ncbi:putative SprT family Zn-dependent metalloprotease [Litorivivens lipolytica]|uniref:Putative SprT family Zn-dependent metalloprotease n=1 Tax=Litorivivens lipolytica TaxID=1524264 RepID=A0A7W4W1Y5_9GAMM|nr:SprT-like domain-containing protein [Litorivivens lipolytica]MBB3045971.1 putative SprT family Zn-dependent metalloprotease [Litorivivens lipolytica]
MALSDYREPLPPAVEADIHRAFETAYQLAVEELDYQDPAPTLSFALRSARMAGRATPHKNLIELNKVIFRNNPDWEFVYDTVAHEMAHIVATRHYRSRGHDKTWKQVATVLGAQPRASGAFDTTGAEVRRPRRQKTYPFVCACQQFDFGSQRLANFLKGSRYQCRACEKEIRPDLAKEEAFAELSFAKRLKLKASRLR